jgi:hypothetical protein
MRYSFSIPLMDFGSAWRLNGRNGKCKQKRNRLLVGSRYNWENNLNLKLNEWDGRF